MVKERCLQAVRELTQAFALAVPHQAALDIRNDVAFFQAISAQLSKRAPGESKTGEDLDSAIRQIVSGAVTSDGVLDIFAAANLDRPDISILSDDFLAGNAPNAPAQPGCRSLAKIAQRRVGYPSQAEHSTVALFRRRCSNRRWYATGTGLSRPRR